MVLLKLLVKYVVLQNVPVKENNYTPFNIFLRSEVLTAVILKSYTVWNMTSCGSFKVKRYFRKTECFIITNHIL
jgi:hypothetical protein